MTETLLAESRRRTITRTPYGRFLRRALAALAAMCLAPGCGSHQPPRPDLDRPAEVDASVVVGNS